MIRATQWGTTAPATEVQHVAQARGISMDAALRQQANLLARQAEEQLERRQRPARGYARVAHESITRLDCYGSRYSKEARIK